MPKTPTNDSTCKIQRENGNQGYFGNDTEMRWWDSTGQVRCAVQRTGIARDLRVPWSPQQNCAALRSSYASPVSRPRPQAGLSTWSASVSGVPYATSAPRKRLQTCNRPSDLGRAGSPAWHPSYSADATPSRIIHSVVQAGYRCDIDEVCTGRILP